MQVFDQKKTIDMLNFCNRMHNGLCSIDFNPILQDRDIKRLKNTQKIGNSKTNLGPKLSLTHVRCDYRRHCDVYRKGSKEESLPRKNTISFIQDNNVNKHGKCFTTGKEMLNVCDTYYCNSKSNWGGKCLMKPQDDNNSNCMEFKSQKNKKPCSVILKNQIISNEFVSISPKSHSKREQTYTKAQKNAINTLSTVECNVISEKSNFSKNLEYDSYTQVEALKKPFQTVPNIKASNIFLTFENLFSNKDNESDILGLTDLNRNLKYSFVSFQIKSGKDLLLKKQVNDYIPNALQNVCNNELNYAFDNNKTALPEISKPCLYFNVPPAAKSESIRNIYAKLNKFFKRDKFIVPNIGSRAIKEDCSKNNSVINSKINNTKSKLVLAKNLNSTHSCIRPTYRSKHLKNLFQSICNIFQKKKLEETCIDSIPTEKVIQIKIDVKNKRVVNKNEVKRMLKCLKKDHKKSCIKGKEIHYGINKTLDGCNITQKDASPGACQGKGPVFEVKLDCRNFQLLNCKEIERKIRAVNCLCAMKASKANAKKHNTLNKVDSKHLRAIKSKISCLWTRFLRQPSEINKDNDNGMSIKREYSQKKNRNTIKWLYNRSCTYLSNKDKLRRKKKSKKKGYFSFTNRFYNQKPKRKLRGRGLSINNFFDLSSLKFRSEKFKKGKRKKHLADTHLRRRNKKQKHKLKRRTDRENMVCKRLKANRQKRRRRDQGLYRCQFAHLRNSEKPCLCVYIFCPKLYPTFLVIKKVMRKFARCMFILVALLAWLPCFVAIEFLRLCYCS